MSNLDLLQWPAMAVTMVGAWFVASKRKHRRNFGYWLFLSSNVLWVAWGLHVRAYALVALQLFLMGMNVRGLFNTEPEAKVDG
jgi:hypothetical protein